MSNEELKKKIIEILDNNIRWQSYYYISRGIVYEDDLKNIADALIDANIFVDIDTLKDEQQSMNRILVSMSSYMNYKLYELEHRAEVAEKAFDDLADEIYQHDVRPICDKEFFKQARFEQAEKELAEEENNNGN